MNKGGFDFLWGLVLSIIIGLVAALTLLYFLLGVNTKGFTLDETCKLSVLTRSTVPDIAKKELNLPLKCSTEKLCISNKFFGKCDEQFLGNDVDLVRVSGDAESSASTIEKTIADSMLSCWKMMGEGKLDLFGKQQDLLSDTGAQCVICSRIAIDNDFINDDKFKDVISQVNVNDYLESHQAPQSQQSYLSLFTDNTVGSYGKFREEFSKEENKKRGTDEIAILFAQINTKQDPSDVAGDVVGAGFILLGGSLFTPLGNLITNPIAIVASLAAIGVSSGFAYERAADAQTISAAYCGQFSSSESNKKGCSVVTAVDYNKIDEINKLCAGGILGTG